MRKVPIKKERSKLQEKDQLMEHKSRAEGPEPSRLSVNWQAAYLMSGPLDFYRHYKVSVVDWLERRKVFEVGVVEGDRKTLLHPGPCHSPLHCHLWRGGKDSSCQPAMWFLPQYKL